jgi:hypothetical protein
MTLPVHFVIVIQSFCPKIGQCISSEKRNRAKGECRTLRRHRNRRFTTEALYGVQITSHNSYPV